MGKAKAPDYKPLAAAQREAAALQHQTAMAQVTAWEKHQDQAREDFQPFREYGLDAIAELSEGEEEGRWTVPAWEGTDPLTPWDPSEDVIPEWAGTDAFDPASVDVTQDPGYQFRLDEGEKAIRRHASAGSGARTGATYKALTRYGQDYASNEYGKARERAVQDYVMNRKTSVEDYDIQRRNALGQEQLRSRDYEMLRGNELAERNIQLQDYDINSRRLMSEFDRISGQAQVGLGATAQNQQVATHAQGQQSQYATQGTAALAAGGIGSAQALVQGEEARYRASQQGFTNMMSILGLGVGAAGAFSDRRLKEDIERVGELYNGLPVYLYRFKGEDEFQIGVIADEVEKFRPEAVGERNGFKTVDYKTAVT